MNFHFIKSTLKLQFPSVKKSDFTALIPWNHEKFAFLGISIVNGEIAYDVTKGAYNCILTMHIMRIFIFISRYPCILKTQSSFSIFLVTTRLPNRFNHEIFCDGRKFGYLDNYFDIHAFFISNAFFKSVSVLLNLFMNWASNIT